MRTNTAITGMGMVSCLGGTVEETYARMCAGDCGLRPIDRFPVDGATQPCAGQLPATLEARLHAAFPDEDLAAAMVKTAGLEALIQAGRPPAPHADPRLGLVLATNFGLMETLEWCWRERVDHGTIDRQTFDAWAGFPRAAASFLGCGGPVTQLSLSCASGGAALALAKEWLEAGLADRVLAIGYDALTAFCWTGLTNLRTITLDKVRPFDARRSGTIFGEGAAAALLEACPPNAPTPVRGLAWLAGAATNNNAFHMTAPAKEGDGSRRAMAAALQDAGIGPERIDHVCAHATATVANDVTETAALRALLGERLAAITVAAHKSQLGHMLGAASLAEALITVEVMRHGIIPPTINHETPDPACALDCVPGRARRRTVACALLNSAGIGGNNSALVLERVTHE